MLEVEHEGVYMGQGPKSIVPRTLGLWYHTGQGPKPVGPWALAL